MFVFSLLVRALVRLLVLPSAGDGTKDLEILVLRHQLGVLRRKATRPRFTAFDRILLAVASRALPRNRWTSFLVTPQTLLRWAPRAGATQLDLPDQAQARPAADRR